MRDYSKLLKLADDHDGYVFTRDVVKKHIPKDYLKYATKDGVLQKVGRGIYISDAFIDDMFIYQQIHKKVIYSACSSAYLFGLTTRIFEKYYGATPMAYNRTKLCKENCIVGDKNDVYKVGLTTVKTNFGNTVFCHDIHRTICDLFSNKYIVDRFVQIEAVKTYLERDDKNLLTLMLYAHKLGLDTTLQETLEVLLQW